MLDVETSKLVPDLMEHFTGGISIYICVYQIDGSHKNETK
jgi:hypothetical protein